MPRLDQAQREADDGKWLELLQGRDPRRPTEQEGGWAPQLFWMLYRTQNSLCLSRNEPRIIGRLVGILVYIATELLRFVGRSDDRSSFNFTLHDTLQVRKSVLQVQCERK
jgi:hypothetical protein